MFSIGLLDVVNVLLVKGALESNELSPSPVFHVDKAVTKKKKHESPSAYVGSGHGVGTARSINALDDVA